MTGRLCFEGSGKNIYANDVNREIHYLYGCDGFPSVGCGDDVHVDDVHVDRMKAIPILTKRGNIYLTQTNGLINNINAKKEHGI